MIKFFRKIRQKLLVENRFNKYLLYAFGEIILVVIGILIALQINNWNENKKQTAKTKSLIERLLKENKNNQKTIATYLETYETLRKNNSEFFNLFNSNIENIKSYKLDSLFFNSIVDFNLIISLNTLNEAMDNGEISTIKNEALRKRLYNLTTMIDYIKERVALFNDDNNNFLFPFLYKNTNLRKLNSNFFPKQFDKIKPSKMKDTDYKFLLNNREFENLMTSRFAYTTEITILFKSLSKILDKMTLKLEEELKNYK